MAAVQNVSESEVMAKIESAANVVMAPPNQVSKDQRNEAEKVLLEFRQSKQPFRICSTLVQHSSNDFVRFQAISTMKDAVIREWSCSDHESIQQLLTFIMDFVVTHSNAQAYVREQILSTVAVILKRSALDKDPTRFNAYRSQLFEKMSHLLKHSDEAMQIIGCSILTNLLNEFSSNSRASALGVAWESHTEAKEAFEKEDMKEILTLILQMLHQMDESSGAGTTSRGAVVMWNRLLALAVQIFGWEFVKTRPKGAKRRMTNAETSAVISFRPPNCWRQLLFDSSMIPFLFKIHRRIRHNSELSHHLFQCLTQLASLGAHAPIFADDDKKILYLQSFVEGILGIMQTSAIQDYESPGLSQTISQLLNAFSPAIFLSLPNDLFSNFIYGLTHLTSYFGKQAASEETANKEDQLFGEAYETLLKSWMTLLNNNKDFAPSTFRLPAIDIINGFVQSHLAPPDGSRGSESQEDDEEIEEEDGEDRENFRSQLICVGMFFREALDHSFPLLTRLVDAKIVAFKVTMQRLLESSSNVDRNQLYELFEDLHWLALIANHVTVEESGEYSPSWSFSSAFAFSAPCEILQHLAGLSGQVDEQKTAEMLSGVSALNWSERLLEDGAGVDPLVRLFASFLHLSCTQAFVLKMPLNPNGSVSHATELLSPQLASDVFYFFSKWSRTYFLHDLNTNTTEKSQLQLPSVFSSKSASAPWILDLLLDHIFNVLVHWSSEQQVVAEAVLLLTTFVDTRSKAAFVIQKSSKLWELTGIVCDPQTRKRFSATLPVQVQRDLMLCLTLVGAFMKEESIKQKYWSHVLEPLQVSFKELVDRIPTPDKAQAGISLNQKDYPTPTAVVGVLESLIGVSLATKVHNLPWLFDFLQPMLQQCPHILSAFNAAPEVVEPVLRLFNTVVQHMLSSLNDSKTNNLYEISMQIIQTYFKHNFGKHSYESTSEDEQFSDLFILMDLLTNLLNKDVVDFWSVDENSNASGADGSTQVRRLSSADVVLCGINFIIPLMNEELLKYPPLCIHYYKLLEYIAEVFPEKIANLPEENSRTLLNTINLGLSSFGSQVSSHSLTFLRCLANHLSDPAHPSSSPHHILNSLSPFLPSVFSLLLLQPHFDMELLEVATRAFFSLIAIFQNEYMRCVNELLAAHADQPHHSRLVEAFQALTPSTLPLNAHNRSATLAFTENMQTFLLSVRGLLCTK